MLISGFTILRNAIKFNYPFLESIQSILPICDEFIINVGNSDDKTLEAIQSFSNPKIKLIYNTWDFSMGKEVLSYQTNLALKECQGTWAFYLQADEVIHQNDLAKLKNLMTRYTDDQSIDALRFKWFHFYGSYYRYRIDAGWYQKQFRIVRNNGQLESFGDAFGFQRKDGAPVKFIDTGCLLYHYGWVQPREVMAQRRINAEQIGFISLKEEERTKSYSYGDLNRFPVYFGTHPSVMDNRIATHELSQDDLKEINRRYWWNPLKIFKTRYKTGRRVKEKIV